MLSKVVNCIEQHKFLLVFELNLSINVLNRAGAPCPRYLDGIKK